MASRKLSEPDACSLLRTSAMHQNKKIVEVAAALISGQAGFKATPARLEPVATEWHGFILVHGEAEPRHAACGRHASPSPPVRRGRSPATATPARLERGLPRGERIETVGPARGTRRVAILGDGRLAAVLFVTRSGELPARDWLIAQFGAGHCPTVLVGRAPGAQADRGAIVCVCFDLGMKTIVATIGAAIGAGTKLRLLPPRARPPALRHQGNRPWMICFRPAPSGSSARVRAIPIC